MILLIKLDKAFVDETLTDRMKAWNVSEKFKYNKNHSREIVGTKYWVFRCSTYEVKAISNYSSINFSNFAYFEKCILEFTSELFDVLFTFSAIVKEITTQLPHDRDNYDDTGNFWMYRSNQWIKVDIWAFAQLPLP